MAQTPSISTDCQDMHSNISTKLAFYSILTVLTLLLFIAAAYVNYSMVQRHQNQVYNDTQKHLSLYHHRLFTNLQSHMQIVRGLPGLFAVNPDLTQEQFTRAVKHLVNSESEIRNIAAAPGMVIRYMYPVAGNEKAIGLDYRQTPLQFEAADRARRTRELVLAGPLELKQGGVGLISRIPVFLQNETGKEYFWGLISAVIDVNRFFEKSGLLVDDMPIKIAIRGADSLGRQGAVFFGDAALFENPRLAQTLKLPEGEWLLTAAPLGGWSQLPENIWQKRILVYGTAMALFLLLAMFVRFIFAASLANHKFRNLIESSPVPYVLLDGKKQISFINRAFTETYGYRLDQIRAMKSWWDVTAAPLRYQEEFKAYLRRFSRQANSSNKPSMPMEVELHTKQGQRKVALLSTSVMQDTFEDEMLLVIYDITARKEAEEQLRFSSRVFNQAQEGIIITDTSGAITDVNPAFCDITGYSREEVIGQGPEILNSGKHSPEFFSKMWQSIIEHGYWQGEVWNRRKNGELYAELLTISALSDDDGLCRHFVGLFSDITQTKQQQETLELMAHYDVLTKLPNRVLFADRFSQAVAHSKRTETLLAVCFLDLDNFKPVNDTYGHEVGDQLLIEVAQRLKANVRDEDTISRFGGDEFAILFRDVGSQSECEFMLQRIHESLARPYSVNDLNVEISASSGVTFYPTDNADLDTLLRHADQTMYQAKLSGRNTYKLFNPAHNRQTMEKQQWLQQIRQGLEQGQFRLFYQPKVNMRTGQVFGMEALIRWQHPDNGLLSPVQFLPLVEGSDLEIDIGNWVIHTALSQLQSWHDDGHILEVSVNVASSHLQSADFIDDVEAALAAHPGLDSRYLQLEIVETSALGDIGAITKAIKLCREVLGVSVALDDFGTGYSSLTHLRHLTASTIKIDQSFVRDMLDDPQDYTIVDGVSGLADAFNRQVIAEGVETNEHGLMLLMIGCDLAQGFGIAKPMPAEDVPGWLEAYQPNRYWMTCAAQPLSLRQRALKLFSLISNRWYQSFISSIQQQPETVEHWPIMAPRKCHCGSWIQRVRSQGWFDVLWLDKLEASHDRWHALAYELRETFLAGNDEAAREALAELERLFDDMQRLVEAAMQPATNLAKRSLQPDNQTQ
ncbi:EAL domain-containing protein [Methylophaga sp. OBS4]|uniref:bifunctional diguanylate cyclase/phosphodiesterase n=1 Tax=Methylophaga sp. OBS4 TaxID=2991935 RepID=UPI0022538BAA|nr:EAL domain-containing protein [Methylophaga sp. OBS4]MCX4187508.1 EAL domain-containing protein [Methylophaga sp. OBS4]